MSIPNAFWILLICFVGGFVLGAAIGALLTVRGNQKNKDKKKMMKKVWPVGIANAIALEAIILVIITIFLFITGSTVNGRAVVYLLIVLMGLAMGIQSTAIRHLNIGGVATTYITGTLTSLVTGLVRQSSPSTHRAIETIVTAWKGLKLQAMVYVVYILAAVVSGFIESRSSLQWAILLPLIAVMIVVVVNSLNK
jgi:uncharacterized membrane protein YoaK (UPF0700 family)